jgi:hypothetical protein
MPPLSTHKTLTDAQKQTVRLWIEQGARWGQPWAFVAPLRPPLPAVKGQKWRPDADRPIPARKNRADGLTPTNYGRDYHPRCFTMWMAGAGVKGGIVYGETDDFSYNIVKDPVHVRGFQATILHQFGNRARAILVPISGVRCQAYWS